MNLKLFLDRPILATVISIFIVLIGLVSLFSLPMETYPNIAPPTIQVTSTYYGANAETVQKSAVAPLEEQINGVEGMMYMKSSSSNSGCGDITIYFKQGSNPDMASVFVQNRVARATGSLPAEVTKVGVVTDKRQTSMLQVFSLYSPDDSYDEKFLANYLNINLKPRIQRVTGVGGMNVFGGTYSMRIWLKPDIMAQHKLVPADITSVLSDQNLEAATGSFGENSPATYKYVMKYTGRKVTPEEFRELTILSKETGEILKLKDVADIEMGTENYNYSGFMDGHPGVSCMIFQTAGSNATEVNNEIGKILEEAKKDFPKGVAVAQILNSNDFLYASMHNVVETLIETIILVIIVVYVFLQDFRSAMVPLVGVIVSVIGTFAFMSAIGFTLNLITLFALVLVIGTVVDDSIVVVEAVQSRFDTGYRSPYKAALDATKGVCSAVITSSLVFMVVFIPVSFIGGTSGTFYRQFGLSMAVAVGLSALNALTLSPALCSLWLKPYVNEDGTEKNNFASKFRKAFNSSFSAMVEKYRVGALFFIHKPWLVWSMMIGSFVLLMYLMGAMKTSLVPEEDQGVVMASVSVAPGSSLKTTENVMIDLQKRISTIPEIQHVMTINGYGMMGGEGCSFGSFVIRLKPWEERTKKGTDINSVIGKIYGVTAEIKDASLIAFAPPSIAGYGMGNNIEMFMQDKAGGKMEDFFKVTQEYIMKLNQRPEIAMAFTAFNMRYPQWKVEVDADKCKRAGVNPSVVLSTLGGYYGGQYVSNFNRFSQVYKVMIQADPKYRMDESSLQNSFVRMSNGEMAPLSQFVTLTRVYGSETLDRFNRYNSISLSVMPQDGYSIGQAIKAIEDEAEKSLPKGYGFDFGGMSRELRETSGNTGFVFVLCFVMIYLILCGLYESFLIPFAVLLSVPCGLMGSFLFGHLLGLENNIYLQVGLIMLIGLLAKTAILLTEYASERRKAGMSLTSAAVSAARARLRPILMTVLTMVVGLFPLVMATGVGANGNHSLGSGVIGGMLVGTFSLLFFVPYLFIAFQWLQEKISPIKFEESNDSQLLEEMQQAQKERQEYLDKKNRR